MKDYTLKEGINVSARKDIILYYILFYYTPFVKNNRASASAYRLKSSKNRLNIKSATVTFIRKYNTRSAAADEG
jgi:hypothetical protein